MNATAPERSAPTAQLSGVIERVTFFNEESGFCVLRIKAPGHREEVTVIGSLPSVNAGEWLSGEGWWVRDKEHGLQFKAGTIRTVPPTTVEGIERYLSSGLVKGIGPVLAKKLVGRFRADVLNVIETRSGELLWVDGIGPKRRERISLAWREAKQVREIMLFLHGHGVSTSRAVRIFKAYGDDAIEKVRSKPLKHTRSLLTRLFVAPLPPVWPDPVSCSRPLNRQALAFDPEPSALQMNRPALERQGGAVSMTRPRNAGQAAYGKTPPPVTLVTC